MGRSMKFKGCCSHPHGFFLLAGLLLVSVSATACTWYAFISCRFVLVDFQSYMGGFSVMFANRGAGDYSAKYRISAGLFSWLEPVDESDFANGECTGYSLAQTNGFADKTFNAVQYLAVTSVLLSIAILIWIVFMACFSLGRCQSTTMPVILFIQTILVGLSFLTLRSGLCQDVGDSTSCKLGDGGLLAVAAVIFWFMGFLLSWRFVASVKDDLVIVYGEIQSRRTLKRQEKQDQQDEDDEVYSVGSSVLSTQQKGTPTKTLPIVQAESGEGEMEVVYVKRTNTNNDPNDTVDL